MCTAIEWKDAFRWEPDHKILTETELKIPGLLTCGYLNKHELHEAPQRHFHRDAFEIAFVLSGELLLYCGGEEYHIKGGDAFISQPNEPHDTNGMPYAAAGLFWIQLDAVKRNDLLFLSEDGTLNIRNELKGLSGHTISTDNGAITTMVRSLCSDIFAVENRPSPFETACRIVSFLYHLIHFARKQDVRISPKMRTVVRFIEDSLPDVVSLDELAAKTGLSLSGFKHRFKKETGISPHAFILREKISYAKKVLPKAASITELSAELGFSSSSHFAAVFKKHVGMTPREWIKT